MSWNYFSQSLPFGDSCATSMLWTVNNGCVHRLCLRQRLFIYLPRYVAIAASISSPETYFCTDKSVDNSRPRSIKSCCFMQKYTQQLWLTASHAHPLKFEKTIRANFYVLRSESFRWTWTKAGIILKYFYFTCNCC